MTVIYSRKFNWSTWNYFNSPKILQQRRDSGADDGNCGEMSLYYLGIINSDECVAGTAEQVQKEMYGRSTDEVEKLVSRKTLATYKFNPYTILSSQFSELCKSKIPLHHETIILLNRPDGAGHYCIVAHLDEELMCDPKHPTKTEKLDVSRIMVIDPQNGGLLYKNPVNSFSIANKFVHQEMMQVFFLEQQSFTPFNHTLQKPIQSTFAFQAYGRKRRGNRSRKQKEKNSKKREKKASKKVKRKSLPKNKKNKKNKKK